MNKADGLDLLRSTPNEYAKLVIFDPQYRQVLDQLKFGNEGKRQKGRALLPQQSNEEIYQFGAEIVRVLKPGGYVMLWCDKFILCQGMATGFFQNKLKLVDLATWDKGKIGMGKRTRRRCEHAMFFQKAPHVVRTKALVTWKTQPCIADVWPERIKDKIHAHQKPLGLQKAVIEATTELGDVVIDPVAGSFSVMHAAHACGRRFLGGDILGANGGIERLSVSPVELSARHTRDGWNSRGDGFGEPNLTGAILEFAAGPTGPNGNARLPLEAMGVRDGPTGPQRGAGPLN
jgi:site-specific DNA-methyltransferase (adenine-specific)